MKRSMLAPLGVAFVAAVSATAALALFVDAQGTKAPSRDQRQVPLQWLTVDTPVLVANPVDWSRIEVSEDPGPLAVAAYGP